MIYGWREDEILLDLHSGTLERLWDEQREAEVSHPVLFLVSWEAFCGHLGALAAALTGYVSRPAGDSATCGCIGLEGVKDAFLAYSPIDWLLVRPELVAALSRGDGPVVLLILDNRIRVASLSHQAQAN
ncbi:hypothetical protein ACYOEI_15735 [Singulisphaera rosea]